MISTEHARNETVFGQSVVVEWGDVFIGDNDDCEIAEGNVRNSCRNNMNNNNYYRAAGEHINRNR